AGQPQGGFGNPGGTLVLAVLRIRCPGDALFEGGKELEEPETNADRRKGGDLAWPLDGFDRAGALIAGWCTKAAAYPVLPCFAGSGCRIRHPRGDLPFAAALERSRQRAPAVCPGIRARRIEQRPGVADRRVGRAVLLKAAAQLIVANLLRHRGNAEKQEH